MEDNKVLERNNRHVYMGTVISDKMDKTITVAVVYNKRHPLYGKVYKITKKVKAHDEKNECKIGDVVEIMSTRPLSKDKHYRLVRIVESAK